MTEAVQVALIVAMAPTIASLASLISSMRNHEKINKIEKSTNGMQAQLLENAKKEGHIEGVEAEKKQRSRKS